MLTYYSHELALVLFLFDSHHTNTNVEWRNLYIIQHNITSITLLAFFHRSLLLPSFSIDNNAKQFYNDWFYLNIILSIIRNTPQFTLPFLILHPHVIVSAQYWANVDDILHNTVIFQTRSYSLKMIALYEIFSIKIIQSYNVFACNNYCQNIE